jgi:hypothetical protein
MPPLLIRCRGHRVVFRHTRAHIRAAAAPSPPDESTQSRLAHPDMSFPAPLAILICHTLPHLRYSNAKNQEFQGASPTSKICGSGRLGEVVDVNRRARGNPFPRELTETLYR